MTFKQMVNKHINTVFLNDKQFADAAVITTITGVTISTKVIFSDRGTSLVSFDDVASDDTLVEISISLNDHPTPKRDDKISVNGVTYVVKSVIRKESGMALLSCERKQLSKVKTRES